MADLSDISSILIGGNMNMKKGFRQILEEQRARKDLEKYDISKLNDAMVKRL